MLTEQTLHRFTGTENYYRHWMRKLVYTDGLHYLEKNGAAWLLDVIASHQLDPKLNKGNLKDFQLWELKVKDSKGIVTCKEDSDKPAAVTQEIEYTDFPLESIKIFVELGSLDGVNECKIAMLPSER